MNKQITPYKSADSSKKEQVADMFNNISGTYDFLNHFLSVGIDIIWRKNAIAKLKALQPKIMLDVATGTGDFAIQSIKTLKPSKIVGVDISSGMLDVAKKKIESQQLDAVFSVEIGDSENLNFPDNTFDAITVAFGVRNFQNLNAGLKEIHRVLKPGGKLVVLEFSMPRAFPIKQLYNFYFRNLTPFFGKLFSKDARAYTYLNESVEAFPDRERFTSLMSEAGFKNPDFENLTFGISSIYTGVK